MRDATRELAEQGFCVLRGHLAKPPIENCREAFWPLLLDYLEKNRDKPNRGEHRHFLPMPFAPPCFAPEFFFDAGILEIARGVMGKRIVADQWGCDTPVLGQRTSSRMSITGTLFSRRLRRWRYPFI